MAYETILVDTKGKVGVITLNRPKVLNALSLDLSDELCAALADFDANEKIGCIVITGSEKAFAAGADIKEMQSMSYMDAYGGDFGANWDQVVKTRKPIIAAVSGYALGAAASWP